MLTFFVIEGQYNPFVIAMLPNKCVLCCFSLILTAKRIWIV